MFYHLSISFKDSQHPVKIHDLSKEEIKGKIKKLINDKPVFLDKEGNLMLFENIQSVKVKSSEEKYLNTNKQMEIDQNANYRDSSQPPKKYFFNATKEIIEELTFL